MAKSKLTVHILGTDIPFEAFDTNDPLRDYAVIDEYLKLEVNKEYRTRAGVKLINSLDESGKKNRFTFYESDEDEQRDIMINSISNNLLDLLCYPQKLIVRVEGSRFYGNHRYCLNCEELYIFLLCVTGYYWRSNLSDFDQMREEGILNRYE